MKRYAVIVGGQQYHFSTATNPRWAILAIHDRTGQYGEVRWLNADGSLGDLVLLPAPPEAELRALASASPEVLGGLLKIDPNEIERLVTQIKLGLRSPPPRLKRWMESVASTR